MYNGDIRLLGAGFKAKRYATRARAGSMLLGLLRSPGRHVGVPRLWLKSNRPQRPPGLSN